MPITEAFTGSETVTSTEWSLTTDTGGPDAETSDGVFQIFLDLNALVAGDQFRVRVYEKVTSASTQRIVYEAVLTGAQSEPIWVSPSLIFLHGWDVTLYKLAGTDRAIDWSIRKVA